MRRRFDLTPLERLASLRMKKIAAFLLAATLAWAPFARAQEMSEDDKKAIIACYAMYTQLKDAGFIKDENISGPFPVFIVDESQWRRTEYKNKAKLGDVIGCLLGSLPGWSESEFRSNLTNNLLGKLNGGRLEVTEP